MGQVQNHRSCTLDSVFSSDLFPKEKIATPAIPRKTIPMKSCCKFDQQFSNDFHFSSVPVDRSSILFSFWTCPLFFFYGRFLEIFRYAEEHRKISLSGLSKLWNMSRFVSKMTFDMTYTLHSHFFAVLFAGCIHFSFSSLSGEEQYRFVTKCSVLSSS